ncbi:unnamed protein product, partial [Iphiclides podalirius]
MALLFEKIPRLLRHYSYSSVWIPLIFSSNVIIGLNTNIIAFFNLLELAMRRNPKVARYPGLVCLLAITLLFFISIPLQTRIGINVVLVICRIYLNMLSTFIAIIECCVFVILYGIHRFGEDIHFMQGVQTSIYMKIGWVLSCAFLVYGFCGELHHRWESTALIDVLGRYLLATAVAVIALGVMIKLIASAFRKNFAVVVRLDPTWGPRSEVLQRSRAMFTAQAMTKEYMYRQYHLQAGITARQKRANRFRFEGLQEEVINAL